MSPRRDTVTLRTVSEGCIALHITFSVPASEPAATENRVTDLLTCAALLWQSPNITQQVLAARFRDRTA